MTVNDGFMRGVEAGVTIQGPGTKAQLHVEVKMLAKTVSNVFKELQKYKQDFSKSTWEKIESAHTEGKVSFYYGLMNICSRFGAQASGGVSYDYENKETSTDIKDDIESQRVAQALQTSDQTEVIVN